MTIFAESETPRGLRDAAVAATAAGVAVLDEPTRRLHQLHGLSASVWVLCDGHTPVGAMPGELAALFGVGADELRPGVDDALDALAAAGLIEDVEVPMLVADPPVEQTTDDGTRILTGPADPCGPEADRSQWAGSVVVRIGAARDALVVVQGDSNDTVDALRTLLGPRIEPAPPPEVFDAKAMFSVWATPLDAQPSGTGAPRTVPQLRRGSRAIARSRRPDDVYRALALALGNAHVQEPDDGQTWIGLRAFTRSDRLVLADIDPPEMVSDPRLRDRGIDEAPSLAVRIGTGGVASLAPSLPDLAWDALGVEPPAAGWRDHQLRGIVSMRTYPRDDDEQLAKMVRYSLTAGWFHRVVDMANDGTLVHTLDHRSARDEIDRLLG